MSVILGGPGQAVLVGGGGALSAQITTATPNFPMSLTLTNYHNTPTAAPVVTIGMAFAQGDIPPGSRLKMVSSGGTAIVMQEDGIASWGDGSRRFSALSFTSPDNFTPVGSAGATQTYTLSVEAIAPNTNPAFSLAAFVAATDIKVLFSGFDCGANVFACSFNHIVNSFATSPYEGQFPLAQAAALGAQTLIVANPSQVSVGMLVSGLGIAANTLVTAVSGAAVQISQPITQRISAGVALEFGSPLGGYETLCSGPNCMEWKAWSYLQAISGPNAGAYHTQIRCTLYVRAWGISGPYEIYAQVECPNLYGTIPAGTVGPAGPLNKRFVCTATVQNGSKILYYFGGPNDPRSFTVAPGNFQSDGTITIASAPNWLHLNYGCGAGVSFTSTGSLPGDLSSSTPCWLVPSGTTNNAYIWIWRLMSFGNNAGNWAPNTVYGTNTLVFSASGTYNTLSGGTSGTVAPAGPGPVTDGTVTWARLSAANFTTAGTGTITLMPTLSVFPMCSAILASASGEPIWSPGTSGISTRPHLMPAYNQSYLCHQTKFTLPYDLTQTTYPRTSAALVDRGVFNVYTEYSPGQSQPWGWIISQYGDDPGDERVGYFSSSNAYAVYQQTDPITDLIIRSEALGFGDYPYNWKNERSGQPVVSNAGPDRSTQGRPYPGLGPVDLALTSTSLIVAGSSPVTFPAQYSADWSGHQDTYGPVTDESHMPLLFPMPYLRTGHRIYLDNSITLAASLILTVSEKQIGVGSVQFYGGLAADNTGQLRGQAWRLKCVAQANFMMPDAHIMKPYFRDYLDDTARYFSLYWPNNVLPVKQLATLGFAAMVQNPTQMNAYQLCFLTVTVGMEAWRDAIDAVRPQWKEWILGYCSRWQINMYDWDQGGGFYNLTDAQSVPFYGTDPSAAFQTPAQYWANPYNSVSDINGVAVPPNTPGFLAGATVFLGTSSYPFDTVNYWTLWACALSVMAYAGSPKASVLWHRFKTATQTAPYTGIVWSQNAKDVHYDLLTAQAYMPWCCAPPS